MKAGKPSFIFFRFLLCIATAGTALFFTIDKHNELTELRIMIPALVKEVQSIQAENVRLQYEVDRFESPIHLMELARKPEFSHLKHPFLRDIVMLEAKEDAHR